MIKISLFWAFWGLLCAVLCSQVSLVYGEDTTAPILTFDESSGLISAGIGSKKIGVKLSGPLPAGKSVLKAELRKYGAQGDIDKESTSTDEINIDAQSEAVPVQLSFNVSNLGFYELKLSITTSKLETLTQKETTVAILPERKFVGPSEWGVCTHFGQCKGAVAPSLDLIKLAGFSRIRDELYWESIEATPGERSIPKYADFIDQAYAIGLSPLIILQAGNAKAYPELFARSGFPDNLAKRELFCQYVTALVNRFKDKVKFWEVWNEPVSINPRNYALLETEVYTTIKALEPDATVISCGGAGAGGGPSGDYLLGVIEAGGADIQDGFSIHPYMAPECSPDIGYPTVGNHLSRVSVPTAWKYLQKIIDSYLKKNGAKLELWVTEIGWPNSPVSHERGEWIQGAYLARTYLLANAFGTARAVFWYDFQDDGTDPKNKENNFGLIRADYSPKPAYQVAAILSSTLTDRKWVRSVSMDPDVSISEYSDNLFVGWSVGTDSKTVTLNSPPGIYTLRDWSGNESQVNVTEEGYAWTLRAMPQYLIKK